MTKISFCMPTFNEEADVGNIIESLQALRHTTWELVIVDASTDSTPWIIQGIAKRDPRIFHFRQFGTIGRCGARNQALQHASGDIICVLNADASVSNEMVCEAIKTIKTEAVGSCTFRSHPDIEGPASEYLETKSLRRQKNRTYEQMALRSFGAFSSEGVFVDKAFIDKATDKYKTLYPAWHNKQIRSGDDTIAFDRLRNVGLIGKLSEVKCKHRVPNSSTEMAKNRISRGIGNIEYQAFYLSWSRKKIFFRTFVKLLITFAKMLTMQYLLYDTLSYIKLSNRRFGLLSFVKFGFIDRAGHAYGEFTGLIKLCFIK